MRCKTCQQDHTRALQCIGAKGGRAGKGKKVDPEKMRKAAQARWSKKR